LHRTHAGWPLHVIGTELVTNTGEQIEVRMHAFYTFVDHVGHACAWAPDLPCLDAHQKTIMNILLAARLDLAAAPIVSLFDL
jgi:hypothetical protein